MSVFVALRFSFIFSGNFQNNKQKNINETIALYIFTESVATREGRRRCPPILLRECGALAINKASGVWQQKYTPFTNKPKHFFFKCAAFIYRLCIYCCYIHPFLYHYHQPAPANTLSKSHRTHSKIS